MNLSLWDRISVSNWIALLIVCGVMLFIGFYLIPDVNETIYPYVGSLFLVQATIGIIVIERKQISPPLSQKLLDGGIDVVWGFKYFWWTLWWPMFLGRK